MRNRKSLLTLSRLFQLLIGHLLLAMLGCKDEQDAQQEEEEECIPTSDIELACNGLDDNCDELIDDVPGPTYYRDSDGDTFGNPVDTTRACSVPKGYVENDLDCSDTDAAIHPGVQEVTDGIDNNCNLLVDENEAPDCGQFLEDADGDGFGLEGTETEQCNPGVGWTFARGDCDDADPDVHPGAIDVEGDAADSDCGGSDAAEPHLGLNERSSFDLQAAIDSVDASRTIWVGPGIYQQVELLLKQHGATLRSTHYRDLTVLDGTYAVPVLELSGTNPETVKVDGFTLQNGGSYTDCSSMTGCLNSGGAIRTQGSTLDLRLSRLTHSGANSGGGGIYAGYSTVTMSDCVVNENSGQYGTGAEFYESDVVMTRTLFESNGSNNPSSVVATSLQSVGGSLLIESSELLNNVHGGAYISGNDAVLNDVRIEGHQFNQCSALELTGKGNRATRLTIVNNQSTYSILCLDGTNTITNSFIMNNHTDEAAVFRFTGGVSYLSQNQIAENDIKDSGALFALKDSSVLELQNNIIAYNASLLFTRFTGTTVQASYNLVHHPGLYETLPEGWENSNLMADPRFVFHRYNDDSTDDLFLLSPLSPAIDGGAPDVLDSDGTRSDIGPTGGPDAVRTGYDDQDADGLYDDWEQFVGLDPTVQDATEDPDQDGLTNAEELASCLLPYFSDTDLDGVSDQAETQAGSDGNDWYDRPEGAAVAVIPDDFATVEEALDEVQDSGQLLLRAGQHLADVDFRGKSVELMGEAGAELVPASKLSVSGAILSFTFTRLNIHDVTFRDASNTALLLNASSGLIERCTFRQNNIGIGGTADSLELLRSSFFNHTSYALSLTATDSDLNFNRFDVEPIDTTQKPTYLSAHVQVGLVESNFVGNLITSHLPEVVPDDHAFQAGHVALSGNDNYIAHNVMAGNHGYWEGPGLIVQGDENLVEYNIVTGNNSYIYGVTLSAINIIASDQKRSVLRHNFSWGNGYDSICASGSVEIQYNVAAQAQSNCVHIDDTNYKEAPAFVSFSNDGDYTNENWHLIPGAEYVDMGMEGYYDIDGTRTDLGLYGGLDADLDRDGDGYPDYFWPGTLEDAPEGFHPEDYDRLDSDPLTH